MAAITIEAATRVFVDGTRALNGIDLHIADGELLVLVGPSGCGKSTLLRALAGLEPLDSGRVLIGDVDVTRQPARERDVAMVFQSYALYPQMSVRENLEFGLKSRGMNKQQRHVRVTDVARTLALESLLSRRPGELSGGQRQRVAMGRAIVRRPQVFLMDEPLSNLDAGLRASMRAELADQHARLGVTTVYVTHDQAEAMTLGSRVAVMCEGAIVQCDTPRRLFDRPLNRFVAGFIGSPPMNLIEGEIRNGCVHIGDWALPLPVSSVPTHTESSKLIIGIRPSDFGHDSGAPLHWPRICVEPLSVEEFGHERLVHVANAAHTINVLLSGRDNVIPSQPIRLAVDTAALYFFEPASGNALPPSHSH
jgi:multiple sugar transport system ATP-binding protein